MLQLVSETLPSHLSEEAEEEEQEVREGPCLLVSSLKEER